MTPLEQLAAPLLDPPGRRRRRRRGRRRMPRQREPRGIARQYQRAIRETVQLLDELVAQELLPRLPELVNRAALLRADGVRLDDVPEDVDAILERIRSRWSELTEAGILSTVNAVADRVARWQAREFIRQSRAVQNIDVFWREPWLRGHLNLFVADNVKLIKSIPAQALDQVENSVHRALRTGTHANDLTDQIRERFRVSEQRANLIARDQVLKLHGEMNRERQKAAGVERYTWRVSGSPGHDERVREDHIDLEGTVHSWDDPPIVDKRTGRREHPGGDYQCRCTAEPIFEDDEENGT